MHFHREDWLMIQITFTVQAVMRTLLNKDDSMYEIIDSEKYTPSDMLYNKLRGLLNGMKINEAENLLFESIDGEDKNLLAVAVDFYSRLNDFDDETLEAHDFSREEIMSGLEDVGEQYGVDLQIYQI